MARKKGGNVIGFDPLAWMKQPETTDPEPSAAPKAAPVAETAPVVAPAEAVVLLGDELTIAQAAGLHQALATRLGESALAVDAGSVRRVDAAGLQLLLAFVRERERRGAAVNWRGISSPLREAANRLGLEQALHLH